MQTPRPVTEASFSLRFGIDGCIAALQAVRQQWALLLPYYTMLRDMLLFFIGAGIVATICAATFHSTTLLSIVGFMIAITGALAWGWYRGSLAIANIIDYSTRTSRGEKITTKQSRIFVKQHVRRVMLTLGGGLLATIGLSLMVELCALLLGLLGAALLAFFMYVLHLGATVMTAYTTVFMIGLLALGFVPSFLIQGVLYVTILDALYTSTPVWAMLKHVPVKLERAWRPLLSIACGQIVFVLPLSLISLFAQPGGMTLHPPSQLSASSFVGMGIWLLIDQLLIVPVLWLLGILPYLWANERLRISTATPVAPIAPDTLGHLEKMV